MNTVGLAESSHLATLSVPHSSKANLLRSTAVERWQRLEADALTAWRANDVSRARDLMLEAVAENEAAVDVAAMFFMMIKDYDEAVLFFRRGLFRMQERQGPGKEIATYMLWLAEALRKSDNAEEAKEIERQAKVMWPG